MDGKGHIFQLSVSPGGVPKTAVRAAEVGELGLAGDYQRDRKYHGGPERALCLFALETILQLQREGHPIYPGSTGENITTAGIDFSALAPGSRLLLGGEVLIEITGDAPPCRTIQGSFKARRFSRIAQKTHPGESRLYARILRGGRLEVGASVAVEPAG
ncbi:MAG TPA: MOSC domain-containing protein [Herpetosiphonaceae bacterium]